MDILIGENLFFVKVANMDLIYRPLSRMGGDRVRGYIGVLFILSILEYYFNRVHENLVQHPSNTNLIGTDKIIIVIT